MIYYTIHCGNFENLTAFMTEAEVGVYVRLQNLYMRLQQPFPADINKIASAIHLSRNSRGISSGTDMEQILRKLLTDHFDLIDGYYVHKEWSQQITEELMGKATNTNRATKAANVRWDQYRARKANAMSIAGSNTEAIPEVIGPNANSIAEAMRENANSIAEAMPPSTQYPVPSTSIEPLTETRGTKAPARTAQPPGATEPSRAVALAEVEEFLTGLCPKIEREVIAIEAEGFHEWLQEHPGPNWKQPARTAAKRILREAQERASNPGVRHPAIAERGTELSPGVFYKAG